MRNETLAGFAGDSEGDLGRDCTVEGRVPMIHRFTPASGGQRPDVSALVALLTLSAIGHASTIIGTVSCDEGDGGESGEHDEYLVNQLS